MCLNDLQLNICDGDVECQDDSNALYRPGQLDYVAQVLNELILIEVRHLTCSPIAFLILNLGGLY